MYVYIENKTDDKFTGILLELDAEKSFCETTIEFFILKTISKNYYTIDLTKDEAVQFSAIDSKLNRNTLNSMPEKLEMLNDSVFLTKFSYYLLEKKPFRNYYANWVSLDTSQDDLDQSLIRTENVTGDNGLSPLSNVYTTTPFNPSWYDIALTIPTKFDFLYNMHNLDHKLSYNSTHTLVSCVSKKNHLNFTPYGHWNYMNPSLSPPFHITIKSLELPANTFIGSESFGIDPRPIVSLGTLYKHTLNNTEYIVYLPGGGGITQSFSIRIEDIHGKKLEIHSPSYIIVKLIF